jgi:hypothetical protein
MADAGPTVATDDRGSNNAAEGQSDQSKLSNKKGGRPGHPIRDQFEATGTVISPAAAAADSTGTATTTSTVAAAAA